MPAQHWMTFATFSEQEFFTYPSENAYHGVIINANMVAHAPAGIAAFLLEKVSSGACFLIDPLTHAFQHNPETISNENGPKSSIKTLAQQYGAFIADLLGKRPLSSNDVMANRDEFVDRVLQFQWGYLENHFAGNENAKYFEGEEIRRPSVLVAPYFYLTEDNFREWLPVNRELAIMATKVALSYGGCKVYGALVISRAFLQVPELRQELVAAMDGTGIDGVLLWVDDFDEAGASALELRGFVGLCSELRARSLEILNLHGGYFSCLTSSDAFGALLTGISHGPEFGESRSVVPVGGGIPISRFYVPDLHLRMKFRDFLPVALRKNWLADAGSFHAEVCACQECVKVLAGDVANFQLYGESEVKNIKRKHGVVKIEFPTTEAKKRCLRHYLERKVMEFDFVLNERSVLLDNLAASHHKFADAESPQTMSHLLRWRGVLETLPG